MRRPFRNARREAVGIRVTGSLSHGGIVVELSWKGEAREVMALGPGESDGRIPQAVLREHATDKVITRGELEKLAGISSPSIS